MATGKPPTSYRLSTEARGLLERLAKELGLSLTGVLEMAIRKLARQELPAEDDRGRKPKK